MFSVSLHHLRIAYFGLFMTLGIMMCLVLIQTLSTLDMAVQKRGFLDQVTRSECNGDICRTVLVRR